MTLEPPFCRSAFRAMDQRDLTHHVSDLGARPPMAHGTPPLLRQLLARCWSAVPSERPSAGEVVMELAGMVEALGVGECEAEMMLPLPLPLPLPVWAEQKSEGLSDCLSSAVSEMSSPATSSAPGLEV
jgi:hypothetical protein